MVTPPGSDRLPGYQLSPIEIQLYDILGRDETAQVAIDWFKGIGLASIPDVAFAFLDEEEARQAGGSLLLWLGQ